MKIDKFIYLLLLNIVSFYFLFVNMLVFIWQNKY